MKDFEISYWNNRYNSGLTSGYGSYGEALERKLNWLKGLGIESISDMGCGDFNFGSNLLKIYPKASYMGYDISNVIIEKNKKEYPNINFTNELNLPDSDLLLCVDVLFHIKEDEEYNKMLEYLKNHWKKYLAVTAYEREALPVEEGGHVKVRNFDYKQFGTPIIREISEEAGELRFYLFKK